MLEKTARDRDPKSWSFPQNKKNINKYKTVQNIRKVDYLLPVLNSIQHSSVNNNLHS